jgi:hypothetical protein
VFESPLCDQKKNDKHALGVIARGEPSVGEEREKEYAPVARDCKRGQERLSSAYKHESLDDVDKLRKLPK